MFESYGGIVHQAEDEIAAAGVAIGASYAGKVAFTVTSGPGLALKTEFIGLATMSEIPLVVLEVQRGGPSTGLPTKVEQSDLLAALFGQPGDTPKVVLAPATIEECFHLVITARRIAEAFRCVVIVLVGRQPGDRRPALPTPGARSALAERPGRSLARSPKASARSTGIPSWACPADSSPDSPAACTRSRVSRTTSAARWPTIPESHERGCAMRSRKLAVLQETLKRPTVYGDATGDLLVVGWGSTKGAIEEAVDRARDEGLRVSSLHLTFLSPLPSGHRGDLCTASAR